MTRRIVDHVVEGMSVNLDVVVTDEPGEGGANHFYHIVNGDIPLAGLRFQKGALKEVGDVNGITNEALLAVVIDRLRGFQKGQFSCRENALALTHAETALMWLQARSRDRIRRNVEGTHAK